MMLLIPLSPGRSISSSITFKFQIMNIIEQIQERLDDNTIHELTSQIGADSPEQTEAAANGIISTLIAGLSKNTESPEGAASLVSALDRDHDGSFLNDLTGHLFGRKQPENPKTTDGEGILDHILGNKKSEVPNLIQRVTGMDRGKIMQLMITLAPMVLGILGKMRKKQGIGSNDISDLLRGTVTERANQGGEMNIIKRWLDADGDGNVMDDIANFGMKNLLRRR